MTEHGVYHTILGPLRMAEAIPAEHKECRLVPERGLYWLTVPYPAQCDIETPSGDGVVALDPGVRTFLTYFSETECGSANADTGSTISRTTKEPNHASAANARRAGAIRAHTWWTAPLVRWLSLPAANFRDPRRRAGRKIRSKTARMMLTFRHYEFKQRFPGSAAHWSSTSMTYTSKTRSWDGSFSYKAPSIGHHGGNSGTQPPRVSSSGYASPATVAPLWLTGTVKAILPRPYPPAGDAAGTTKQASGQHQGHTGAPARIAP